MHRCHRLGIAAALLLGAAALADARAASRTAPECEGAIRHPLQITATPLDPVRRGATLRVRVTATTARDLARGELRLADAGGAPLASTARARFGRLRAGETATHDFAVRVPESGHRFLLQFRVTGEGPHGPVSRGATYNVLPDGPADPGRLVAGPDGAVVEYRARRIDR